MACATFGLVFCGLIGGPIARFLVRNMKTPAVSQNSEDDKETPMAFEKPQTGRVISSLVLIETLAMIAICMVVGKLVSQ